MIAAKGLVMKQFVLNEDNLRKGWSGASEFWFSRPDMQVHSMAELADLDHPEDTGTSAYLLSLGYIPYFYVTDGEVMRAFVQSIGNAKIKAVFDQTPDDAVVETFGNILMPIRNFPRSLTHFRPSMCAKRLRIGAMKTALTTPLIQRINKTAKRPTVPNCRAFLNVKF